MAKEIFLKQIQGTTFAVKGNTGHWLTIDNTVESGGSAGAPTSKELVLYGLAGCTSTDVVEILRKKKAPMTDFEVRIKAEERHEHPRIFTSVHIEYVIYGQGVKKEDVERAIELSTTKYCSVSAIISGSVTITHSYRIEPSKGLGRA
jgi:putative redox protein